LRYDRYPADMGDYEEVRRMLIECPECKKSVSDQAPNCPSCGFVIAKPEVKASPPPALATSRAPAFTIIAVVALFLGLFTPRILLFFPIMLSIGAAVAGFARKEPFRLAGVAAGVAAIGLLFLSSADMAAPTTSNLESAQLVTWNWVRDRDFGTHGTIKWNVLVKNISDKPIESVKVNFTSYDANGHILASTFTFVEAIPPGETRSSESYADLYGNETTADAKISEVRFSQ
jgi:zinc-ribbon domain